MVLLIPKEMPAQRARPPQLDLVPCTKHAFVMPAIHILMLLGFQLLTRQIGIGHAAPKEAANTNSASKDHRILKLKVQVAVETLGRAKSILMLLMMKLTLISQSAP